ncbi:MAG: DUF2330 domain-containing protein [Beutenbergiaceae bacterium]
MGWLRVAGAAAATVLVSVLGLAALPPAQACACGGLVAADGVDITVSGENAVLSWDGTTERMVLSMNTLTDSADAAILIPTPAPAEVTLAEVGLFAELEDLTSPEVEIDYRWWPDLIVPAPQSQSAPSPPVVSVLDSRQLGDLEVSTLAASDANALSAWLAANGYVMRDGLSDALVPYVSEGWYYLAVRLTTDAANLSGALQPLDITFPAERLIYPMRLSAAATGEQSVRIYVFADTQMQRVDESSETGESSMYFAGEISASSVSSDTLVSIIGENPYLTVLDQYFDDPGSEIVSDFQFGQAPSDTPFRQTTTVVQMREIGGLPAGPVLTISGMLLVLIGTLTISGIRRYRRRHRPADW